MASETRRGSFWTWLVVAAVLTAASAVSFTAAYYEDRDSNVEVTAKIFREAFPQNETPILALSADEPNIVPWIVVGSGCALLALVAYAMAARQR